MHDPFPIVVPPYFVDDPAALQVFDGAFFDLSVSVPLPSSVYRDDYDGKLETAFVLEKWIHGYLALALWRETTGLWKPVGAGIVQERVSSCNCDCQE